MHPFAFHRGSLVLLTLHSPRQKFFGVLLQLRAAGVALRGVPLESLDDLARQLRSGDTVSTATLFFPMHRVEQMELDTPSGELPSLAEQFTAQSGRPVMQIFGEATDERGAPSTLGEQQR